MSVSDDELLGLPEAEKLRIIELLWDQLDDSSAKNLLPDGVEQEGLRRLNEIVLHPEIGLEHQAVWHKLGLRIRFESPCDHEFEGWRADI